MTKNNTLDIIKECNELIARFKRLKKALDEEDGLSPAQRAAADAARSFMKETAQEIRAKQLAKKAAPTEEELRAQQLAKTLQSRGILGTRPPPRQPTDEELFGHLVPKEEEVKKAEQGWNTAAFGWLAEASKPISSRFKNAEEEQAYWDSIKVEDRGGGDGGY